MFLLLLAGVRPHTTQLRGPLDCVPATHRAVQSQCEQHQEEDDSKESGGRHVCNGLSVGDEEEAGSWKESRGLRVEVSAVLLQGGWAASLQLRFQEKPSSPASSYHHVCEAARNVTSAGCLWSNFSAVLSNRALTIESPLP